MKKKHPILGVICLAILICGGIFTFRAGGAKAEITIGEKIYEMRTMTVREFMEDGYILATMSAEGKSLYTYNYSGAVMEAKTYYNTAVPFKPKDGAGAPLSCWLYNPTSEQVEIREGKICAISCKAAQMQEYMYYHSATEGDLQCAVTLIAEKQLMQPSYRVEYLPETGTILSITDMAGRLRTGG